MDYRRLDSVTKKDVYPLPRINDMLDSLSEARVFSTFTLPKDFGKWRLIKLRKRRQLLSHIIVYLNLIRCLLGY